jgi:hypothetical protein
LFLGVFLALGMSLAAVQASDMVVKMVSSASDIGATGQSDGCNGCGGSDDGKVNIGACLAVCMTSAFAVLPSAFPVKMVQAPDLPLQRHSVSWGRSAPPDPYPPRPSNLG